MNAPRPGPDEIVLSVPLHRHACNSLEHASQGRPAEVIVTFGQMGEPGYQAFWPECWGRSFAMCAQCWQQVEPVVRSNRPRLTVTGPLTPASAAGSAAQETGGWGG